MGLSDELKKLELHYVRNCPVTGYWRHEINGARFCMYDGRFECEYKVARPAEEGAGFYCKAPEVEKDGSD